MASIGIGVGVVRGGGPLGPRPGYYVRKTGNDTTGDGSFASPWLTLTKAWAVAKSTAPPGGVIYVGAGTYAESKAANARFQPDWDFPSAVKVESESGTAADVIIGGDPAGTTYEIMLTARVRNLTFSKVTLKNQGSQGIFIGNMTAGFAVNGLTFNRCVWKMDSTVNYAMLVSGGAWTCTALTWRYCTLTFAKTGGSGITLTNGGGTLSGLDFSRNTVTTYGVALALKGFRGPEVSYNTFTLKDTGGSKTGICFGAAGDTVYSSDYPIGRFTANVVDASLGTYSHVCGCGANHPIEWLGNTITKGDIFVKVNSGSLVTNNILTAGWGIELKQAMNVEVTGNDVTCPAQRCFTMPVDAAVGSSTSGVVVANAFRATGSGAKCYQISNAADGNLGAGMTIDGNTLVCSGGGVIGDVRAATGITTLAGLKAAWDSYGDGTNGEDDTLS